MRKNLFIALFISIALSVLTIRVSAQSPQLVGTSPPETSGVVDGVLVNRSPDGTVPQQSLSVMLHILDQDYNQLGMLHSQSQADGSFRFDDVPLGQNELYAGIVTYQGATYYSPPVPYDGKNTPSLELPIYDTSPHLTDVQIDEMHVLFNFAQDGLEVSEIYQLSNLGDYTITGTLTLTDGQPATIEFPLPDKADYVFFKPEANDRFVRLDKGFADTAPLLPGERSSSMMVSYLLPYTEVMSYSYTAPVSVQNIDYLVPAEQAVVLDGPNLTGPEITTLQNNSVYQVYSYKGLPEGQTIKLSLLGKPVFAASPATPGVARPGAFNKNLAIEIGSGILGLSLIGVGVWQWRRSRRDVAEVLADENPYELELHDVAFEIARLDDSHERGDIGEGEYQQQRAVLLKQAKSLLKEIDNA